MHNPFFLKLLYCFILPFGPIINDHIFDDWAIANIFIDT